MSAFLLWMILSVPCAMGQDSLRVRTTVDSLRTPSRANTAPAPPDSVRVAPVIRLPRAPAATGAVSEAAKRQRPVLQAPLGAVAQLARTPGSFAYDFGAAGWPSGWSPYGVDPGRVALTAGGLPFNDLVTGAPQYDLLPMGVLEAFQIGPDRGRPFAVSADVRRFDGERPLTELRYGSSTIGLQSVSVAHVQTRKLGRLGPAQFLVGYAGAGARGEYPGSALRRKRQIMAKMRIERPGFSVEIGELFNRHRIGAHAGVQQVAGFTYESIYQRLGATVSEPTAQRETIRNDLWATVRWNVFGADPLVITTFWTTQTLQYRLPPDSTTARVHRRGLRTSQHVTRTLAVEGHLWTDSFRSGDAFAAAPDARTESRLGVRFYRSVVGIDIAASAGVGTLYGEFATDAAANASRSFGRVRWHANTSYGPLGSALVDTHGFGGSFTSGETDLDPAWMLQTGVSVRLGALQLGGSAFTVRRSDPADRLVAIGAVRSVLGTQAVARTGVTAALAVRPDAERGLYLRSWTTYSEGPDLDPVLSGAVPDLYGTLRFGARMLLFKNDLDLDLYVQMRAWTDAASRALHPETGLLVLPDPAARDIDGSAIVDLVAEAGVRGATLFFSFENMLSGTDLIIGNQLVLGYPYPERRFRFGVFWPISD